MKATEINKKLIIMLNGKVPGKTKSLSEATDWKKNLLKYYRALHHEGQKPHTQDRKDPLYK